jgi:hypothetical protein
MGLTVTAPSAKTALRSAPLAALLAGSVAAGLTVSPHAFSFDGWPRPPAPARVQPLVAIRTDPGPADGGSVPQRIAPGVATTRPLAGDPRRGRAARRNDRNAASVRPRTSAPGSHGNPAVPKPRGPGTGRPPASQTGAPQPQPQHDPAPAPGPVTAPVVQVAQAAPGTVLSVIARARPTVLAAVASAPEADAGGSDRPEPQGEPK